MLLLPQLLRLLIPAFAAALRLNVTRHASSCELSHPHGVWEWAADVQIGTPPKTFQLQLDSGFHAMTLSTSEAHAMRQCPEVPMQTYRANESSSSRMYTCADAKDDGVTTCANCAVAAPADTCVTVGGALFDNVNYSWVSDTVRIAGVELPNFSIALFDDNDYRGSWGFKVDHDVDPYAPPWSSMLRDMHERSAISELSYSMCFNATTGHGVVDFGGMVPHGHIGEHGIVTEEPVRMVKGLVTAADMGHTPIYRTNGSDIRMDVDTGSIATRLPAAWAEFMLSELEASCNASERAQPKSNTSKSLVGVCVDAAGSPLPPGSYRSILRGHCYSLTPEQRQAYPDIVFTVPAADASALPLLIRYTPQDYLSSFSSPCARKQVSAGSPFLKHCEGPADAIVTWAYMHLIGATGDDLILGEDLYHSLLHYHNFESNTLGLARIRSCS